jgi:hypothetical protein
MNHKDREKIVVEIEARDIRHLKWQLEQGARGVIVHPEKIKPGLPIMERAVRVAPNDERAACASELRIWKALEAATKGDRFRKSA